MFRKTARLLACLICCIAAHHAWAGGFYLQEQSDSAMGTAYAGAGAMPRDASIMYYNPAGLTALSGAVAFAFPVVRDVESRLPDAVPVPTPARPATEDAS